ncbi:MAG: phytanoyl-CoA dioxygenase family protein [Pseudomonadota bacterium]|nr:phytanoyl-CoA dioxygenase family protein [Pseudomonadota bacterium]
MDQVAVAQNITTTRLSREEWDREGYALVKSAIPTSLLEKFERELQELWRNPGSCQMEVQGVGVTTMEHAKTLDLSHHHYRIIEIQKHLASAREIAYHPSIIGGFVSLFGREPEFCQSLTFEWPSEQPLHQDWCFVTTCAPNVPRLAGVWVAIDKVDADNGPLLYYPGSHRMPRYNYSQATHDGFRPYLENHVEGSQAKTFLANPGDVLLWHGDLAHAGSAAINKSKRRLSLVLHYSF